MKNTFNMTKATTFVTPLGVAIEIVIYLLTTLLMLFILSFALPFKNLLWTSILILSAIYLGKFCFILLVGLTLNFLPKPNLGPLTNKEDYFKFALLANISKLIRRSWVKELFYFNPFPGKIFYALCGARMGNNIHLGSSETIPDPFLIEIGDNCVFGENSIVSGHFRPNNHTTIIDRVLIGNNVTIGRYSSIWPGVRIGDNAVIREQSSIMPGTIVKPGEIWGGIPARNLKIIEGNFSEDSLSTQANQLLTRFINNYRGLDLTDAQFDIPFAESGLLDSLSFIILLETIEAHFRIDLDLDTLSFHKLTPKKLVETIIHANFKNNHPMDLSKTFN